MISSLVYGVIVSVRSRAGSVAILPSRTNNIWICCFSAVGFSDSSHAQCTRALLGLHIDSTLAQLLSVSSQTFFVIVTLNHLTQGHPKFREYHQQDSYLSSRVASRHLCADVCRPPHLPPCRMATFASSSLLHPHTLRHRSLRWNSCLFC